jgi:hypothetical protein
MALPLLAIAPSKAKRLLSKGSCQKALVKRLLSKGSCQKALVKRLLYSTALVSRKTSKSDILPVCTCFALSLPASSRLSLASLYRHLPD